jgi:TolB-like protein/tetratricopeptide (TPR) repeat protein
MKRVFAGGHRPDSTMGSKLRSSSVGRDRFHVGVLPFLPNRGPEDEDLAFSISQDIAVALARYRRFDVVPPQSLADRSSGALVSAEVAQFQDLDYVVEGAVSRNGKRVHVNIQLLDLDECARTIWNERLALTLGKSQGWSKLVATRIVGGIDPIVLFFDRQPQRQKRDGASGLLLLAISLMSGMERRKYEEAGRLIDRALEIEPDNAMAAAWAAFWQVVYFGQGWTQNFVRASAIAQTRARRAIDLAPEDAEVLTICGHVNSFLGRDYDVALHYFDRAQRLDPNLEFTWMWSALTYCYLGKPSFALERLNHYSALRSGNVTHVWARNILSIAYAFAGDYEKAVEFGRVAIKISPTFVNCYKPLIASLGHLGRYEEAKPYVDKLLALEPNFTVERFGQVYPIKYDGDREHYMKGLRLAGVPER